MFSINLKKIAHPFILQEIKSWFFMLYLPKSGEIRAAKFPILRWREEGK